jgi:hypothetical protein
VPPLFPIESEKRVHHRGTENTEQTKPERMEIHSISLLGLVVCSVVSVPLW